MKPQPFRLGRVLRLRRRELDHAAIALATAAAELAAATADVDAARLRLLDTSQDQQRRLASGLSAVEYRVVANAVESARRAEQCSHEHERTCEARRDQARRDVLAARSSVRALEGLRDRCAREQRVWRERVEQRELDEVGTRSASRQEVESL